MVEVIASQRRGDRLRALAEHLDPSLRAYLVRLLRADSDAHRYDEVRGRAERAEAVVAEQRLQMDHLERRWQEARAEATRLRERRG